MNFDLSVIKLPKGKTVQFKGIDAELDHEEFPLEEDITLRFGSEYQQLVNMEVNKAWVAITSAANVGIQSAGLDKFTLPSAGYKQLGFQQWSGSKPVSFRCAIALHVEKFGAWKDVVEKSKKIMKMGVPTAGEGGKLIAPGPSAIGVFLKDNKYANRGKLTIRIGALHFYGCIIKAVEPTISQQTDILGNPIWIKLNIECETLYTVNSEIIDQLFNNALTPDDPGNLIGLVDNEGNITR